MPLRFSSLAALLAIAIAAICPLPAHAQTKPVRAATGQDTNAAAPRSRAQTADSRNSAAPLPAARGSASKGSAPKQVQPAPRQPIVPAAPFELTEAEQNLLDQILLKWERQSDKINTFKCSFTRWEYDPVFGPAKNDHLKSEGEGYIKYKTPDRGMYSISELKEWDAAKGDYVPKTTGLDHWVCDGKAIFEFNAEKKQLIERKLPPAMQGKAIVDGPLPFLFGAKADQLKKRYWLRDVTPTDKIGTEIWLEAVPKRQQDAANFQRAKLILSDPGFLPQALQIYLPGDGKKGDRAANTAYLFKSPKVNDPLSILKLDFMAPMTPLGWKRVVEDDAAEEPKEAPPAPDKQGQAKRISPATTRK